MNGMPLEDVPIENCYSRQQYGGRTNCEVGTLATLVMLKLLWFKICISLGIFEVDKNSRQFILY
jgi:hypothetical protein